MHEDQDELRRGVKRRRPICQLNMYERFSTIGLMPIEQWKFYTVNIYYKKKHSKTESDVWSYWKWSCLREGAWLCQDSPTIIFLLENTFFWQPLYLLTKQKYIFTIFVNAEYPELRSEASNIIFWAPLKANEGGRSDVSQKMNFLPHYGS